MINKLAIIFIIALSGCTSTKPIADYVPPTLDEAITHLKTSLSEDDLNHIKNANDQERSLLHFDFGRGLRNSWGLWTGSALSEWFNQKGIYHAEDMSGIILNSLYLDLHGHPTNLDEQIKHYQAHWEEVKKSKKLEAELDIIRSERRKSAMLDWEWVSNDAPTAILPRNPDFFDVWGLMPYAGGYIIVIKKYRQNFNPIWHDGIYFLSSQNGELKPVSLEICSEIHDVVVINEIANWLCKETDKSWSLISTTQNSKPIKKILENIQETEWLRLGKGSEGILLISSDTIYQVNSNTTQKVFIATTSTRERLKFDSDSDNRTDPEYFLPHRSATPIEHQGAIFFQVENTGNDTDLYRLRLDGVDLESLHEIYLYDYVGNWGVNNTDLAIGNENELWLGSSSFNTLVKINKNGNIGIASLFSKTFHINSIDDSTKNNDWRKHLPTSAILIDRNDIYLAGGNGIAKVTQGKITPIVYFTYPKGMERIPYTSRPQYDYHIRPQRLGMFADGSFVIGDSYNGVYVLKKIGDDYRFYLPSVSENKYLIN